MSHWRGAVRGALRPVTEVLMPRLFLVLSPFQNGICRRGSGQGKVWRNENGSGLWAKEMQSNFVNRVKIVGARIIPFRYRPPVHPSGGVILPEMSTPLFDPNRRGPKEFPVEKGTSLPSPRPKR